MRIERTIVMIAVLCAALVWAVPPAAAQGDQDGAALLAAGAKALDAGEYKAAARHFSRAMRSDSLSTAQISKALYLRGAAHRNANLPAQAIADLTSALWLQGLSKKELAQVYATRGLSYQDVGMTDLASADLRRARELDPNSKTVAEATRGASPAASTGTFQTRVETAEESSRSRKPATTTTATQIAGFSPEMSREARSAPTPARPPAPQTEVKSDAKKPETAPAFQTRVQTAARAPEPAPAFRTSILPEEPAPTPAPRPKPKSKPAPSAQWSTSVAADQKKNAPAQWKTSGSADEEKSDDAKPSGTLSGFFSNLWGGDKKKDEEKQAEEQEAGPPVAGQWSQTTRVATATPSRPQPQTAAPTGPTPASSAGASGNAGSTYRIQLAALRSEAEAQSAWSQLSSRHRDLLAGQEHIVEKTTLGALGTFYRIQIGPFTDKKESTRLCSTLKSSGVDCFVVAR